MAEVERRVAEAKSQQRQRAMCKIARIRPMPGGFKGLRMRKADHSLEVEEATVQDHDHDHDHYHSVVEEQCK